ncbi:MAG: PEP-CTERM sorting domain-containing protein [Bryobacterales bacterium]|nr:PEP-CTERM sorting domain-containing protein [Bryobacteraceae bacterium]MDW8129687.1 PEP-CTERM sorting domain-containing protein [Bryobacterales bacterium]
MALRFQDLDREPGGTGVLLFNRRGGSSDNLLGTIFDDSAPVHVSGGWGPFAGRFRPEQPLSAFNGQNAGGTWALFISDVAYLDEGFLNAWSLEITEITAIPEPSTLVLAGAGLLGVALLARRRAG